MDANFIYSRGDENLLILQTGNYSLPGSPKSGRQEKREEITLKFEYMKFESINQKKFVNFNEQQVKNTNSIIGGAYVTENLANQSPGLVDKWRTGVSEQTKDD